MNTEILEMSDGAKVQVISSVPIGTVRGHIHLVHGMAEHIGRYEAIISELTKAGYVVTGLNQRGHGQLALKASELGDFEDGVTFDRLVEDVRETLLYFKEKFPHLKRILFGHSMGSFVVRRVTQKYGNEIDALICSGTAGNPGAVRIGGILLSTILSMKDGAHAPSYLLDKLGFGSYNNKIVQPETKFDWLSTDRQVVKDYMADPLAGVVSSNRFFQVLFEGLKLISDRRHYRLVPADLPILLFSGTDDPVGNMGAGVFEAAELFNSAGVRSVTVHLVEGERHESLQGYSAQTVVGMMLDWMETIC